LRFHEHRDSTLAKAFVLLSRFSNGFDKFLIGEFSLVTIRGSVDPDRAAR